MTKINIAIMIALTLALTGCDTRQYDAREAKNILQAGREQMEDWISLNCPEGEILSIENAVRKLPGGPAYLLPGVKGELSDGEKDRDFLLNMERDKVYLAPDTEEYFAFQRECLSYTLECLGMEGLSMDEDDEENNAFFYIVLIKEMVEPDPEYGTLWDIDGYASTEYVKFPGELVLSGGSIQDYIRDPGRGDVICVELTAHLPDNVMLSSYTTERIKAIEEEHGLYFKKLSLETAADEISIVWGDHGRFVDYDKKEENG